MSIEVISTEAAAKDGLAKREVESNEEVTTEVTEESTELAAAGDEETEETEEVTEEAKPKKKGGFQKKLEKASNLISEQAKKLADLESRLAEKETAKPAVTENKPKIDDFDSHAEFTEALADWKFEQREKEKEAKTKQSKAQDDFKEIITAHDSRVEKFKETATDWEDALEEIDDIKLGPAITEAIVTSDLGPEVMYHLAKNRDELERINKLGPLALAKEIGKLELRLEQKETPKPKLTKAPEPLKPVGGKAAVVIKKDIYDPDLSFAEYDKLRAAEEQKSAKTRIKG